jgi:hypothetical protein
MFMGRKVKGKNLEQLLRMCETDAEIKCRAENVRLRLEAIENAVG